MEGSKLTYIKPGLGHTLLPIGLVLLTTYPVKVEDSILHFQVHETGAQRG